MKNKNINDITKYCQRNYKVIKNYNLAFDIGANIGGFISAYHLKFNKIIAVEAISETFAELKKNVSHIKNVELLNIAVSDKSDKILDFYKWNNNDSGSVSSIKIKGQVDISFLKVKTISYEDLVKRYGVPDYIKIDCEGCEYDFLMNKDLTGIEFMAMELHYGFLNDEKRNELLNYLLKYFNIYCCKQGIEGCFHSEYNLIKK